MVGNGLKVAPASSASVAKPNRTTGDIINFACCQGKTKGHFVGSESLMTLDEFEKPAVTAGNCPWKGQSGRDERGIFSLSHIEAF
jgi:hypothetical protein